MIYIRRQCRLVKMAAVSAEQATSITYSTSIPYYGVPSVHFPSVPTLFSNRYALNLYANTPLAWRCNAKFFNQSS